MSSESNPFADAEAWEVSSDTFLAAGDHVTEILEIDGSGNSSGGHPQIEVKVGNADGAIRDWIVVIPSTVGKVMQLAEAAGVRRPEDEEVTPEGTGFRLSEKYLELLRGKRVGTIVRPEADRRNPGEFRDRVRGYVPASQIAKSDVTPSNGGTAPATAAVADDDIPF